MGALSLRLLGPVEVQADGRRVDLGPRKQRLLLAILALEANRPVDVARLIDLLWPVAAPRTAPHAVQVGISALRSALAGIPDLAIERQGSGYALVTDPGNIDVHLFRSLLMQARAASDDATRAALLDRALRLWAGPGLAGTAPPESQQRLFAGLDDARLGAQEDLFDARLRLGHHHELADEIAALADAHPFRERLAGQLMLALYRDGRPAEALGAYRRYREYLADELGLDPGAALQQLELAILRSDQSLLTPTPVTPAGPVPAQLPAASNSFTGRADALRELDALARPGPAGAIAVITGTAGVGKTALAVQWAHRHRGAFPDGQLYVNLAGYAPGPPMPPQRALTGFLRALGVPAERIPLDPGESAALYRSLLADRTVLVVLDNAIGPEQVRPLLPGGPGCLTVVTSRDRLEGLAVREGARLLPLGVLAPGEARDLLVALLGAARIGADPVAAAELAVLCGQLPLALRIAAAHLARHPGQPVAELAAELREGNRLALLSIAGDEQSAVRAAFDLSYTTLTAAAQVMFKLAGLHPGADLSGPAAAALGGTEAGQARRLLAELAGAHLVDEHAPGRFALHDLLRLYARSRAAEELSDADRAAAAGRLYDFYLAAADAAARAVYPNMQRLPLPGRLRTGPAAGITFASAADALGWLEAERANLVAIAAAAGGPRQAVWLLADALRGYLWLRADAGDWLTVAEAGLAAATAGRDVPGMSAAHLSLAQAMRRLTRYPAAIGHLTQARELAREACWREGEAAAVGSLANVYRDQGRLSDAAECHWQAYGIYRQSGSVGGQATSLGNLGSALVETGRLAEAIDRLRQSRELHLQVGSLHAAANQFVNLGCAYLLQGRLPEARELLEQALAEQSQIGGRETMTDCLVNLAQWHRDAGDWQRASELAAASLALARESGDQRFEADADNTLGSICLLRSDPAGALSHYRDALRLASETGYRSGEAAALIGLADTRAALGRTGEARAAAGQALYLTREMGLRILEGSALTALAEIALREGHRGEALIAAREALAIHRETGYRLGETRTAQLLAGAGGSVQPAAVPGTSGSDAIVAGSG